jgi:L-rhamnose mutarotase
MFLLQIEHSVPDFQGWKKAFDSDPLNRKASGVRHYTISRLVDNPLYVIIELEFDQQQQAEAMHASLKKLWTNVEGKVMTSPRSRIVERLEQVAL